MKHKKHSKIKLRAAFLSLVAIALLAATAAFLGTSAANAVSDSDIAASGSDLKEEFSFFGLHRAPALQKAAPDNLGEPQIVMTTSKPEGETMSFRLTNRNVYVDWGDGNIVESTGSGFTSYSHSGTLAGSTVKIYSTSAITSLTCSENQLTALDVSNNTDLSYLHCDDNNLTTLDVSKNTNLIKLFCESNQLTALDLSKNTALDELHCDNNQLTALDVSNNTALTGLYCNSNKLKFSTIKLGTVNPPSFVCTLQADVEIASSANKTINLSSEYDIGGTTYTWYDSSDGSVVTPEKYENKKGVFTFGDELLGETLYCEMTNEAFPGLTLKTKSVLVHIGEIVMTTSKSAGEVITFYLNFPGNMKPDIYVDWGNGTPSKVPHSSDNGNYGYSGAFVENVENTVKIYSTGTITYLGCSDLQLTSLDVSNNTALKTFYCYNNGLTTLDVSKNTALTDLDCSYNSLTELNVSNNAALETFYCEENQLKFSTIKLGALDLSNVDDLSLSPQAVVQIPATVKANETIDLSSEYDIGGIGYTWYDSSDDSVVTP